MKWVIGFCLLVLCMGADDCNRNMQEEQADNSLRQAVYIADIKTNLCFVMFPYGNATWGTLVPCTTEVCNELIGTKPRQCQFNSSCDSK